MAFGDLNGDNVIPVSTRNDTDYVMELIETTQRNAVAICDHYELKRRDLAVAGEWKTHLLAKEIDLTDFRSLLERVANVLRDKDLCMLGEVLSKIQVINETLEEVKGEMVVIRILHGF